jgi:Lrp/AsnC family transcriptional regulator, leucine-responsive regulatory protein
MMGKNCMDPIDRKLLIEIQKDASRTTDELANLIGSSASSVQRRLARFKREGIVTADVSIVDPVALGQSLTFVVGLEIDRKESEHYVALRDWVNSTEQVQQAYNVTGAMDFILIVTAPTMDAFAALMDRLLKQNPNVKNYRTSTVLQTYKRSLFTPVAGE